MSKQASILPQQIIPEVGSRQSQHASVHITYRSKIRSAFYALSAHCCNRANINTVHKNHKSFYELDQCHFALFELKQSMWIMFLITMIQKSSKSIEKHIILKQQKQQDIKVARYKKRSKSRKTHLVSNFMKHSTQVWKKRTIRISAIAEHKLRGYGAVCQR